MAAPGSASILPRSSTKDCAAFVEAWDFSVPELADKRSIEIESARTSQQIPVTRNQHKLVVLHYLCGCQVNRVIPTQVVLLGQGPGSFGDMPGDLDVIDLGDNRPKACNGQGQLPGGDPSRSICLRESSVSLRVQHPSTENALGTKPEIGSPVGSSFVNQHWDDGRRIEVGDHRR
jgi:hypothetical protein